MQLSSSRWFSSSHGILDYDNFLKLPDPVDGKVLYPLLLLQQFSHCSPESMLLHVVVFPLRDKNRLPLTPILSSVLRLVRYHLGTVAKGSFIITLVKVPRLILMYLHNQLKGKVGSRGLWGSASGVRYAYSLDMDALCMRAPSTVLDEHLSHLSLTLQSWCPY